MAESIESMEPPELPLDLNRDSLTVLIHSFYAEVRRDPALGPVFEAIIGDQWNAHLQRMVEFWSTVMLGTRTFKGNVYAKHVAMTERTFVQPEHFLRWISLWHRHTSALFDDATAAELQKTAHGIGRNLFYGLFQQFARFVVEDGAAVDYVAD